MQSNLVYLSDNLRYQRHKKKKKKRKRKRKEKKRKKEMKPIRSTNGNELKI